MKKLREILPGYERVCSTALVYMLSVLSVCARNMIDRGSGAAIYCSFFVEMLVLVILCEMIDWLVFRFVRSWPAAIITECILITLVCTAAALWRGWIDLTLSGIVVYVLIVLAIYAVVVFLLIMRNRRDAEAITRQIQSD